jgi:hypothetical protein
MDDLQRELMAEHIAWIGAQFLRVRREALEEAAKVADRLVDCDSRIMHGAGVVIASSQIAAAIRALKEK